MVLDEDIVGAVITGQIDAVKAWLAADQSRVNDFATFPGSDMKFTLLAIASTGMRDEAKLPLVRLLLAHGADPSVYHHDSSSLTPLYIAAACSARGEHTLEIVSTLLDAAPLERQIASGMTPLRSPIVQGFNTSGEFDVHRERDALEVIKLLLRHGAPLDDYPNYSGDRPRFSAEATMRDGETKFPGLARNEAFVEAKALIAGVRACGGSWKSYCRLPHKEVLRLRSLISRGRARPRREPILERDILEKRAAAAYRSIVFLCKLGDNGVVWKILEFWQATR
jgi:hypothetical protein